MRVPVDPYQRNDTFRISKLNDWFGLAEPVNRKNCNVGRASSPRPYLIVHCTRTIRRHSVSENIDITFIDGMPVHWNALNFVTAVLCMYTSLGAQLENHRRNLVGERIFDQVEVPLIKNGKALSLSLSSFHIWAVSNYSWDDALAFVCLIVLLTFLGLSINSNGRVKHEQGNVSFVRLSFDTTRLQLSISFVKETGECSTIEMSFLNFYFARWW